MNTRAPGQTTAIPVGPSSLVSESSASPRFQELKWLMRDWADQESEGVSWSLVFPASNSEARFSRLALTRAT